MINHRGEVKATSNDRINTPESIVAAAAARLGRMFPRSHTSVDSAGSGLSLFMRAIPVSIHRRLF
jgi:hypothetical protein